MVAIILAAGIGSRLSKYTLDIPKGLLMFNGETLIGRHIRLLRELGINDIIIVSGYLSDKIYFKDVIKVVNKEYKTSNMVYSLMKAERYMKKEVCIIYGDIVVSKKVLKEAILNNKFNISVTADKNWRRYWKKRYGVVNFDLESFSVDSKKRIIELGKEVKTDLGLSHRYVGIIRLSKEGVKLFKEVYESKKQNNLSWEQSGMSFKKGYMTDMINEVIKRYIDQVGIHEISNDWLEFDTNNDYEKFLELLNEDQLQKYINL